MLLAETAILLGLHSFRMVLLFLHHIVVSLLAFGAGQGDLYTHLRGPPLFLVSFFREISHKKRNPISATVSIT